MCVVEQVCLLCVATAEADCLLAGCPLVSACARSLSFLIALKLHLPAPLPSVPGWNRLIVTVTLSGAHRGSPSQSSSWSTAGCSEQPRVLADPHRAACALGAATPRPDREPS